MIFVDRNSLVVPSVLQSPSADEARRRIRAQLQTYDAHLEQIRLSFDSDIWEETKPALSQLFHKKCAYCESEIVAGDGVVEHFRPKSAAEDMDGHRHQPYYAWLAYEWENLLWACHPCTLMRGSSGNHTGKGGRFPVEKKRIQIGANIRECRKHEKALLIDPCFDNPEIHLDFLEDGTSQAKSPQGRATIDVVGLNRPDLVSRRETAWSNMQSLINVLVSSLDLPNSSEAFAARQKIIERIGGDRPYTAVCRHALRAVLHRFGENSDSINAKTIAELLNKYAPTGDQTAGLVRSVDEIVSISSVHKSVSLRPSFSRHELPQSAHDRIRRIEIRNFKAIEALDIEIPEGSRTGAGALALLGENATAKTTILEAIALTLAGAEVAQQIRPDARELLRVDEEIPRHYPAEVRLFLNEKSQPISLTIDRSGRFSGDVHPSMLTFGYGPQRFFKDRRGVRRAHGSIQVASLFKIKQQMAAPNIWLTRCSQERFDAAIRALRPLLMLPPEGKVNRYPASGNKGRLTFEFPDHVDSLDRFSEGYRSVVAMSVDIISVMLKYWRDLETAMGVVLIDEIETHLHPRWKKRLVHRLREAMPLVQFIITTHDPLCLRGFKDGEIAVLRRDARRIELTPNLPNVQGLSVEQLLTSDFFGLASTEDPDTEALFNRLVLLAAKKNRSPDEEADLKKQRTEIQDTLRLGETPLTRVFYDAMDKYLIERSNAAPRDLPKIDQAAVDSLVRQWHQLDRERGVK